MPDLDHLQIDGTTYDLKDSTARKKDAVQDDELNSLNEQKIVRGNSSGSFDTRMDGLEDQYTTLDGNPLVIGGGNSGMTQTGEGDGT